MNPIHRAKADGNPTSEPAVTSSPVQLRIGDDNFDLERRPLIIARPAVENIDADALISVAKGAIGQGADLVEIGASYLDGDTVEALRAAGVPIVARLEGTAAPLAAGLHAVTIPGANPVSVPASESLVRFSCDPVQLRPGDGLVVPAQDLDDLDVLNDLDGLSEAVALIVDLTAFVDRAEITAVVTHALALRVAGFITTTPKPVRRAAYVIRAVEHAI